MKVDVVILAGGLGTRLRSVLPDLPKPLAPVDGRPFLAYLIDNLARTGVVGRVILSSGYLAHKVDSFLAENQFALPVIAVAEPEPLGTGGAVAHVAASGVGISDPFLVLNGDSFLNVDAAGLLARHSESGCDATLTVTQVDDASRFGTVRTARGRVIAFEEKSGAALPALINAGVYAFSHSMFKFFPQGASSIERDVFPAVAAAGGICAWREPGPLLDIGLPETLAAAAGFLRRNLLELLPGPKEYVRMTNPTSAELLTHFQGQVSESLETLKTFSEAKELHQRVVDAAELICTQYAKGGSLFVAGNGGSAADAQHLVAELVSKLNRDRTPIRAFALTVDTSILTAIGNDYGYKHSFSRQVRGLMRENDVLLAITTSGNSENILEAIAACKEVGAKSILLSADKGGKAAGLTDLELLTPTRKTPRTQELHLILYHNLCELIEKRLVGMGLCRYV